MQSRKSLVLVPRLSCMGREKRAWYTLFVHAQFPQHFWEFGKFCKICSITLTSARHADFSRIKDERRRYSAPCLQELSTCSCIPAKHCSMWLMKSLPLKFTDRFKQSNADSYHRHDIVFDLKTAHMSVRRSITMQAAFQQVNRIDHFSVAK